MSTLLSMFGGFEQYFGARAANGTAVVRISKAAVFRLWSFYRESDVCTRCARVVTGQITRNLKIGGTWNRRHTLRPAYVELLRPTIAKFYGILFAVGMVPWKAVVVVDGSGRPQTIPRAISPIKGEFLTTWRDGVLVDIKFERDGCIDPRAAPYNVAWLDLYAPEEDGRPGSPLAGVLMHQRACLTAMNSEVLAATLAARPPLPLEYPTERITAEAFDDFSANGGGTQQREEDDRRIIGTMSRMRAAMAQTMAEAYGTKTGADPRAAGDTMLLPDTFAGTWPSEHPIGAYHGREVFIPPGCRVARPEGPRVLTDAKMWRTDGEDVLCNLFGIPVTLLHPESVSSRFKTSADEALRVARSMCIAGIADAAAAVEHAMNALYQVSDSVRLAAAAIAAKRRRPRTPPSGHEEAPVPQDPKALGLMQDDVPQHPADGGGTGDDDDAASHDSFDPVFVGENGRVDADAILQTNRYVLAVSFDDDMTPDDIRSYRADGYMSLDTAKRLLAEKIHVDPALFDGDGVPIAPVKRGAAAQPILPTADVKGPTPTKRQRREPEGDTKQP